MGRSFLLVAFSLSLLSCSLSYQSEEPDVSHVPELVFSEARFASYEAGKMNLVLEAAALEQYQDDGNLYGYQVHFTSYNQEGVAAAEGFSRLLSANTKEEQYTLLGGVEITSFEENMTLKSSGIRWDGNTEQLVTGDGETLELQKTGGAETASAGSSQEAAGSTSRIEITGTGFSASGATRTFQFTGPVSGTMYTSAKEER